LNRDGRYAPSPSGDLHLGNLRTALLAWLFARSQGSRFVVRIDDLDPERSDPRIADRQLADLGALGLEWDEAERPLRQSERGEAYAAALERLDAAGLIYECFCSRREIREASSAPHGELPEGAYPGTCQKLSAAERERRHGAGHPAALRVRARAAEITFGDRLRGTCTGVVDDFVVRRKDGAHGYLLAVVVDDAAQRIGEVVRGADLLSSSPRQIWLAEALGLPAIESWAHVPLVLGPDGRRLAKRHGAVSLADRRALGETPAEVLGLLASSLGLCDPGDRPRPRDLLRDFEPSSLPTAEASLPIAWE
jgi:glutamyl-tRNA synthetase